MRNEQSIFDTSNIRDLPPTVLAQLKGRATNSIADKILSLFDLKDQLTTDEILVGLARKYEITNKKRSGISAVIYQLRKAGKLSGVKGEKGLYERKSVEAKSKA